MEDFARPARELRDSGIPNAVAPTAGMGLTLSHLGRVPAAALSGVYSTWPTGTPDPNEEFIYEVDATNGVYWHLKLVPSQASYDWVCVGGSPLFAEVTTNGSTASTTYAALASAGPSIALPRAGDYYVSLGTRIWNSSASGAAVWMSYDIGATGAVDADGIVLQPTTTASIPILNESRTRLKTGLTAVTLTSKYKVGAALNTGQYQDRWLSVLPLRLA